MWLRRWSVLAMFVGSRLALVFARSRLSLSLVCVRCRLFRVAAVAFILHVGSRLALVVVLHFSLWRRFFCLCALVSFRWCGASRWSTQSEKSGAIALKLPRLNSAPRIQSVKSGRPAGRSRCCGGFVSAFLILAFGVGSSWVFLRLWWFRGCA